MTLGQLHVGAQFTVADRGEYNMPCCPKDTVFMVVGISHEPRKLVCDFIDYHRHEVVHYALNVDMPVVPMMQLKLLL